MVKELPSTSVFAISAAAEPLALTPACREPLLLIPASLAWVFVRDPLDIGASLTDAKLMVEVTAEELAVPSLICQEIVRSVVLDFQMYCCK